MTSITNMFFKFKSNIFKKPIVTNSHSFDALVLFTSIPSGTSISWYRNIFITHKAHHLKINEGKIYHLH